jgi:drug/metabolite transporter (DMT)-like permease
MLAWLAYATVAVVWGSTFLAIAWAIESFTPFGLSAARFVPAAIAALLIGRIRREPLPALGDLPRLALVGTLLLTVCMAIIAWAEGRVTSGVTAVMGATVPMFLGILEPRGLGWKGWIGLGVGFAGVALLMWPSGKSPDLAGCLALILSAFLWSCGTLIGRRHASRAGHFTQVGIEMMAAGILSFVIASFTGGIRHAPIGFPATLALIYLILFGSIAAYSAYIYLARVWPPARTGTYAFWNPVVAVLLGYGLRKEPFHMVMGAGLALVLAGVGLIQFPGPRTVEKES